jgi:hypothetical protein
MVTVQLLRLAAEAQATSPLILPAFTLAGVVVGISGQWLVARTNRQHERELADRAVRREVYAKFHATIKTVQKMLDESLDYQRDLLNSREGSAEHSRLTETVKARNDALDGIYANFEETIALLVILASERVRHAAAELNTTVVRERGVYRDVKIMKCDNDFIQAVRDEFGIKD